MKKFTFILLTILFFSCSNDDIPKKCQVVNLGITEKASYYNDSDTLVKWEWKKTTSEKYGVLLTITAKGKDSKGRVYSDRDLTFILKDDSCPILLSNTYTTSPDCDDCDGVYIEFPIDNLKLQKWEKDRIIVGKAEDTAFWVELSEENKYVWKN